MANHTQIDIYTIVDQVAEDRGEHEHGFAIEVAQKVQAAYEEYLSSVTAQRDELLAAVKSAKSWLEGWASADQEIEILDMAIAKCEVQNGK